MAGDRRATAATRSPPPHREGVPGRRLLRRRHRRRGRAGDRDGEAVPGPARALREGRGRRAQPRGQGQPARPDGARQPARRDAGLRGRAAVRRLRHRAAAAAACSSTTSPAAATRRRDYQATGSGSIHAGNWIKVGLARGHAPRRGRRPRPSGRCSRRPTRTPPPAAPTSCAASSRSSPPSRPNGFERLERRRASRPAVADALLDGARPANGGPRAMSMPFYVSPEQVMKDRADYAREGHRPRSQPRRGRLRRRHPDRRREPVAHAAQDQRDLRPHRVRRRRQVQRVRQAAHRRRPPRRPQGLLLQPRGRRRPQRSPTSTRRPSARSSPTR